MTIDQIIDEAIKEDIGDGDHSSLACVPVKVIGKAQLLVKEDGVLAGIEIAKRIFNRVDSNLFLEVKIEDGTKIMESNVLKPLFSPVYGDDLDFTLSIGKLIALSKSKITATLYFALVSPT